jgi:adenylosuccinate lyase
VRGFLVPTYENALLWHERDLTNSASERFILPHVFVLTDDIVAKTAEVYRNLRVRPERMRANLEATKGQVMAEALIAALVRKGMGRQEAHEVLRRASLKAREEGKHLREVLAATAEVARHLKPSELEAAMDPGNYLGHSRQIIEGARRACEGNR